ncbi:MAG TPA: FKBP-type peptidyl-prolyl cis-trans isomerase [Terracidiphilus sp.]|nr:FKBP-type peptidyl-prolyl cis-trans isomerase [Terracidiphilus sp.]
MKRIASLFCMAAATMLAAQSTPTTSTAPKAATATAKSSTATTAKTSATATTKTSTTAAYKLPADEKRIPGVPKTAFTLKYQDIKIGAGAEGEPGKLWHVNYKGWRAADGIVFDSSEEHKRPVMGKDGKPEMGPDGKPKMGEAEPLAFPEGMGRLIPGFDYGVMGMKVGGKRRIFIPWQMAYGTRNIPDRPDHPGIPAKSDLIFDVELVEVTDMPQPQARPMMPPHPAPGVPGTPGAAPKPGAPGTPGAPATPPPAGAPGSSNPGTATPPPAGTPSTPPPGSQTTPPPTAKPAAPQTAPSTQPSSTPTTPPQPK